MARTQKVRAGSSNTLSVPIECLMLINYICRTHSHTHMPCWMPDKSMENCFVIEQINKRGANRCLILVGCCCFYFSLCAHISSFYVWFSVFASFLFRLHSGQHFVLSCSPFLYGSLFLHLFSFLSYTHTHIHARMRMRINQLHLHYLLVNRNYAPYK